MWIRTPLPPICCGGRATGSDYPGSEGQAMKAILDHVGIAIDDLPSAIAFYRDALGLEVDAPEEVASQNVRAHFIPAGSASLELLEATVGDSPIARFIGRRGPGLHHITLRVEDIRAALAQLKGRGTRLVDEEPRPGAEGSLVAFIHPSSAQGVLVELKQAAPVGASGAPVPTPSASIERYTLGNLELISLSDGFFRLDGGAMFGVVPRVLWERQTVPDERNRILLAMRPLVVRGARTMIIDAGVGDKEVTAGDAKFVEQYAFARDRNLDHSLAAAGLTPEDIDIVLATHLHFDHAGGFTMRDRSGRVRPRFPRAQYIVRRGEWEDATHPHERNRASYFADNYVPLADAGVLQLVDEDRTIMPGVRVRRTGGHTMHHQMVVIESGGRRAAFVADMMPTTAHVPAPWIMGYDLYPMDTLTAKKAFLTEAVEQETLVLFEHDPFVPAAYIRARDGKRAIVPASS
jgi:methylmalonyl-CoA epimerase